MASFTVSIRDTDALEVALRNGKGPKMNEEISHNAKVVLEILRHTGNVLPTFDKLSSSEKGIVSQSVAYLVRTDLIIPGTFCFGAMSFQGGRERIRTDYQNAVRLGADPTGLQINEKGFVTTKEGVRVYDIFDRGEGSGRAQEFFRCYVATLTWMDLFGRLDPKHHSLGPAFKLAELTAYLLTPNDFVDYTYTPQEVRAYRRELDGEMTLEFGGNR